MEKEKLDVEKRVSSLETQFAALSEKVESLSAAIGKRKKTEVEKQARKLKLLEAGPYNKEGLAKLNNREIKMLASALDINSFAKNRDQSVRSILEKQKGQAKQGKTEAKK
jgi:uncharacterized coiled-coil protein SlyX